MLLEGDRDAFIVLVEPAGRVIEQPAGAAHLTPRLAPGRIVAAAMAVADAEGLAGLSMRRVATEIGVATMSLYRHIADKDDLMLKMTDAAFGECRIPAHPPEGWRDQLELAARTLWAMFQRHPWLAPALSVTRPQPIARDLAAPSGYSALSTGAVSTRPRCSRSTSRWSATCAALP